MGSVWFSDRIQTNGWIHFSGLEIYDLKVEYDKKKKKTVHNFKPKRQIFNTKTRQSNQFTERGQTSRLSPGQKHNIYEIQ